TNLWSIPGESIEVSIQGQGSTSSFVQKTPTRYIYTASDSNNSTASMCTARSQRVEGLEEMEQRMRAENQQALAAMKAKLRNEIRAELRAEFLVAARPS
ncbi:hypothetical protein A2U01_0007118, partial [Trifolium medium]|nr:hypothetical protein [Trifolium medium]